MSGQTEITLSSFVQKPEGPTTDSEDPEERKLARMLRRENRDVKLNTGILEPLEEAKGPVIEQKYKSNIILEKAIKETVADLKECQVTNKYQEVGRQVIRKKEKTNLSKKLNAESMRSEKAFIDIISKLKAIENFSDPSKSKEIIENIQKKCEDALEKRNAVVKTLIEEIAYSERRFNINQRKNLKDMEILAGKIDKHISTMRNAYRSQLNLVKETIIGVKNTYLTYRYNKWDELHKELVNRNSELFENKFRFIHKTDRAVELSIRDFEDEFRRVKAMKCVQNVLQDYEELKSEVLYNSEKFDYNFQILVIREAENIIFKTHQGRKINELQDTLHRLKLKLNNFKQSTYKRIKKYTTDIKLLHKFIIDTDAKSEYFSKVNDKMFQQIWYMNQKKCQKLITQILNIDKIIHEQQICKPWQKNLEVMNDLNTLPSFKYGQHILTSIQDTILPRSSSMHTQKLHSEVLTKFSKPSPDIILQSTAYKKIIKKILIFLSDKAGFLSDKKIKQFTKVCDRNERGFIRIENLFQSIGISNEQEIDLLINFFIPYTFCKTCTWEITDDPSFSGRRGSDLSQGNSYSSKSKTQKDESFQQQFFSDKNEALKYVTHSRESVENAVVEIITSNTDLLAIVEDSIENIDIAAADADDMYNIHSKSTKKKPALTALREKLACQFNHIMVISHVYVIKALTDFIDFFYNNKDVIPTTGERMRRKRLSVSRLLEETDIVDYWKKWRLLYGVDSSFYTLWNDLCKGLEYYLNVLKERKLVAQEVEKLRKKNKRLKNMLKAYKKSGTFLPKICEPHSSCLSVGKPQYTFPRNA